MNSNPAALVEADSVARAHGARRAVGVSLSVHAGDNVGFYHAAYGMAAAVYGIYALTIYWRWKRVRSKS